MVEHSSVLSTRHVRVPLYVLFVCFVLATCIEPATIINIALTAADLVEIAADRCSLAEQCACRNYHLLVQSKSSANQIKTGPRLVFDRSEFAFGTQCQLGRTPVFPGETGGLVVGNGARSFFTGVTGWSKYLLYSDNASHYLGCDAIFDYDNPYWVGITADRFATLRLAGPGCNNPPLRGKSEYQARYDIVLNRVANIDAAAAKVLYDLYYENFSPTRNARGNGSLLIPDHTMCVNTTSVTWYDVTNGAEDLDYLVAHTYLSGTEAGQAVRTSYDEDACTVVSTKITQACVTESNDFSVPQSKYEYSAKATYTCRTGPALPEQTYSSILYNEYQ